MGILFTLLNIIFIVYFLVIGVRWLAILPFLVMVAMIFGGNRDDSIFSKKDSAEMPTFTMDSLHEFVTNNALVIARSLIVLGGRGLVDIYANLGSQQLFWLLGVHIFLWGGSYALDYDDGKKIFHVGYYVSLLLLLYQALQIVDLPTFFHLCMMFIVLTMAIYASIVYLGGAIGKNIGKSIKYMFFTLFNVSIIILIYVWARDDLTTAVVLSQVYLMALYVIIYGVRWWYRQIKHDVLIDEDHLVEEILDGKRILGKNIPFISESTIAAYKFLESLDTKTTFSLSFLNIILVLMQVYFFVIGFDSGELWLTQTVFRFGLATFFVNYLLLREIGFYHNLQRAVAFVLLNFGIYVSIIQGFGNDIYWMVILGVSWSILNSFLIFLSDSLKLDTLLEKKDLMYWMMTTMLASIVNLYLIMRLPLSNQFRFSVMFLYLGIQCVLILYALRHILKKKPTLTIDQQIQQIIQEG